MIASKVNDVKTAVISEPGQLGTIIEMTVLAAEVYSSGVACVDMAGITIDAMSRNAGARRINCFPRRPGTDKKPRLRKSRPRPAFARELSQEK